MRKNFVFMIFTYLMEQYNAQIHCRDIHQHIISQGLHYIPGSNPCTLCVCDKGSPKWCKSVLCAPPQNCKSFQVGTLCCEFKCLDDILTARDDTYDVALRFIASAVTAILSISLLFFLFHRLKRRKGTTLQNQQFNEDQRSSNSIGYITGSLGYLPDGIGYLGSGGNDIEYHYEESSPQYCLWKPPSNYFPQGEAPPPYEEALRSAQLENDIINSQIRLANTLSSSLCTQSRPSPVPSIQESVATQSNLSNAPCRHDYIANDNQRRQYANIIVEDVTVHNTNDHRKPEEHRHKPTNKVQSHRSKRNTYENLPLSTKSNSARKHERPSSSGYRTQKEESQDYLKLEKPIVKIGRYDVIVENAKRSDRPKCNVDQTNSCSYSKPELLNSEMNYYDNANYPVFNVPERFNAIKSHYRDYSTTNSKSLNRELSKLKAGERSERNLRSLLKSEHKEFPSHRTLPKNLRNLLATVDFTAIANKGVKENDDASKRQFLAHENPSTSRCTTTPKPVEEIELNVAENLDEVIPPAPSNFASPIRETTLKKDDEFSLIAYRCLSSSLDDEDYRSECENCKSAGFTIPDDEESDVLNETMTLQRRPQDTGEDISYYRTSLTLPTNTRKSRAVITNANRENWFTSMQETSSSEEGD